MTSAIQRLCRIDAHGDLLISLGSQEAGAEVWVTVEPRRDDATAPAGAYRTFIESIAGQWIGEFPEMPELPMDVRESL
jgi:hypothetical protein